MEKKNYIVLFFVLCVMLMLVGCSSANQPEAMPSSGNGRLNVVEAFGLDASVRIEILEFDLEDVDPSEDYFPIANVTNLADVQEIIFLLDGDLVETPALLCIPEYKLRFWLDDGSKVDLGFSCNDAEFITGDQELFAGRQFSAPGKFSGLIRSYFENNAAEQPASVNLLKAAEFGDVVQIEIFEQNLGENTAEVNSAAVITDIEVIEEVLLAMSGDFELHPRARCTTNYFITFIMDDGKTVTWGYLCDGDENGILRGDQDYFYGQDLYLGADFGALFERLVTP